MGSIDLNITNSNVDVGINQKISTGTNPIQTKASTLEQQPKQNEEETIKEQDLAKVIENLNGVLGNKNTSLKYKYHEKLKSYYVTLVNDQTQEVVREIPPKKLLDMYASMKEYMGLFVDNKI